VTQTILSARIGAARILSTLHVPIEKLLLDGDDHRSVTTSRHVPFRGFDQHGEVVIARRRLPHWRQIGAAYFITFRLADSVPQALLRQWRDERTIWLRWHPLPWHTDDTANTKSDSSSACRNGWTLAWVRVTCGARMCVPKLSFACCNSTGNVTTLMHLCSCRTTFTL